MIYLNDHDPFCCAWLRNLMQAGLIPEGVVDERPIEELQGSDLRGFSHVGLFAGIAGWCEALRIAGWDETARPVWTISCPCQPFSSAGKGEGERDARHLWPIAAALIRECLPDCIFGEQVGSKSGYRWLDGVRSSLEAEGYTFGAADLPACCAGAPHIRQRLFWCAARERTTDALFAGNGRTPATVQGSDGTHNGISGQDLTTGSAADAHRGRQHRGQELHSETQESGEPASRRDDAGRCVESGGFWDAFDILNYRDGKTRRVEPGTFPLAHGVPARVGRLRGYGNAIVPQVAATFIRAFMEITCQ